MNAFKKFASIKMCIVLISLFIFMAACRQRGETGASVETYEGIGTVVAISESQTHINIDHEEIEGFMDAMKMFFPVVDSSVLSGIQVADSIRFDLIVENGNYAISDIDVLQ